MARAARGRTGCVPPTSCSSSGCRASRPRTRLPTSSTCSLPEGSSEACQADARHGSFIMQSIIFSGPSEGYWSSMNKRIGVYSSYDVCAVVQAHCFVSKLSSDMQE